MKYLEKPLVFDCCGEQLVGILAQSEQRSATGVVVVVGGPQYRAGGHRHFVALARALAAGGFPVFRFDYRGMGDSTGEMRNFEAVSEDVAAAISAFQAACPGVSRIVLWGLCDGASASLLYLDETQDPRVDGLVLINPWVRSEATLARTQVKHYYGRRLFQLEFWRKLLSGKLAIGQSLLGLWRNVGRSFSRQKATTEQLPFHGRMARAWRNFPGDTMLVLSGQDYVAKEFLEVAKSNSSWKGLLERRNVCRLDLPEADHTFSDQAARRRFENAALKWLQEREWEGQRLAS